jgi:hypothetical protein
VANNLRRVRVEIVGAAVLEGIRKLVEQDHGFVHLPVLKVQQYLTGQKREQENDPAIVEFSRLQFVGHGLRRAIRERPPAFFSTIPLNFGMV